MGLLTYCLVVQISIVFCGDVNYQRILTAYISACGMQHCNLLPTELDINITSNYFKSVCPQCRCQGCVINGDCCPDYSITLPAGSCRSTTVFGTTEISYRFVVDSCPTNFRDDDVIRLCADEEDILQKMKYPWVIDQVGTIYKNEYCARCHNESNITHLSFEIECKRYVDFNFISSYEEIMKTLETKECFVVYLDDDLFQKGLPCEPVRKFPIKSCNVTGTWTVYDPDIEWACNNFQLPFHQYKNIFCLMCNPQVNDTKSVISTCIEDDYNLQEYSELVKACELFDETPAAFPFKNIFCLICNKYNNRYTYQDINGQVTSEIDSSKDVITYRIAQSEFVQEFIENYFVPKKTGRELERDRYSDTKFYENEIDINISHLMIEHSKATNQPLCGIYSNYPVDNITVQNRQCSCYLDCVQNQDCCLDFQFDLLQTCEDGHLINKHCRYNDSEVNSLCYQRGELIYDIPVSFLWSDLQYSNVFCAFCSNQNSNSYNDFRPWDIQITCNLLHPPAIFYQLSVKAILDSAQENACNISFQPKTASHCVNESKTINSCNVSGTWNDSDIDILWGCENMTTYLEPYRGFKNIFCHLCNPFVTMPSPTTETTTPGQGNNKPMCPFCSSASGTTLRALFQIPSDSETWEPECKKNEVLDKVNNKCRRLLCPLGYVMVKSDCEPLMITTRNLGYILPIKLVSLGVINPEKTHNFLQSVDYALPSFLLHILNLTYEPLMSVDMISNVSCSSNDTKPVEISAMLEFSISETVRRKIVEETLLSIDTYIHVDRFGYIGTFSIKTDTNLANVRRDVFWSGQFRDICHLSKSTSFRQISHETIMYNFVSELMICQQVTIGAEEYIHDAASGSIRLKKSGVVVPMTNYKAIVSGVRVCLDRMNSFKQEKLPKDRIQSMIYFIATITSLCCLLVTFITYCLFPNLRSIPGKNNMSLVFSLFCLQTVFMFRSSAIDDKKSCTAVGVLIHYFLLCHFTTVNVCTYHMFRVFSRFQMSITSVSENRTVLFYCLYAYTLPALFVIGNISVSMRRAHGSGYGVGGKICFLTHSELVISTVIIPLSLICVVNVGFFVTTVKKIHSTPKIEQSSSHNRNAKNSIIYLKLFSITGITWVFQIIDSFLPITYFSLIFSLLNVLQGVFIFFSYICNDRVLGLYKELFGCQRNKPDSSMATKTNSISLVGNLKEK